MYISLSLSLLLSLSGCGHKQQTIVEIETIYLRPPSYLVEPGAAPVPPPLPDSPDTGQVFEWYREWIERCMQAWKESESDKSAIKLWMEQSGENHVEVEK